MPVHCATSAGTLRHQCRYTSPPVPVKFNWALSKLPFSLMDSIVPLCKRPSSYRDPYQELQDIMLRSYGLSASQRTGKWLNHPG